MFSRDSSPIRIILKILKRPVHPASYFKKGDQLHQDKTFGVFYHPKYYGKTKEEKMGEIQVKSALMNPQLYVGIWLSKICSGQTRCNAGRVTCFTRCFFQTMSHYILVMVILCLLLYLVLEVTSSILT